MTYPNARENTDIKFGQIRHGWRSVSVRSTSDRAIPMAPSHEP
jgi:hypothetical protein